VNIELAEMLRCPSGCGDTYLALATGAMKGRSIHFGTVGCPVCKGEYLIANGIARFGTPNPPPAESQALPTAQVVQAVLGLESPGGYVVLVGSASQLAADLSRSMDGVHFVGVNAPEGVAPGASLSLLLDGSTVPLKDSVARGVVVGSEYADHHWLSEGARVLLRGQRLAALTEETTGPDGVERMAVGEGMWVGMKT
jgi:hypothetical protein